MIADETESWFAAYVVPRHERKVALMLEYNGFRQFLPTCKTARNWSDRVKLVEMPLFPGYVFCRSRRSSIRSVLGIPGVSCLVNFGGKPCPILDEEIDALQQVVQSGRDVWAIPFLSVGRKVRVKEGPLAGISGIIAQVNNRRRLVISVDLITKSVSVNIRACEVCLADTVGS
jgi:transcription antitermination factor NusG